MASEHLPHHARLDSSISLARANVIVVLLSLPTAALLYILYFVLAPFRSDPVLSAHTGELVVLIILLIIGIAAHELLHALGRIAFGRISRRRVRFGYRLNTLTPYAHLQGALPVVAYRMGVILPLLVLGLPPYILGILLARQLV
ncbi:MAG: metalloprotease family protein, partial [Anaerolineales bacterium]|nr:metalloprotease family protein [Anaerolineales bacterium]